MANGRVGFRVSLDGTDKVSYGKMEGGLDLGREWKDKFALGENPAPKSPLKVRVVRTEQAIEIAVPAAMTAGKPEVLAFEWD